MDKKVKFKNDLLDKPRIRHNNVQITNNDFEQKFQKEIINSLDNFIPNEIRQRILIDYGIRIKTLSSINKFKSNFEKCFFQILLWDFENSETTLRSPYFLIEGNRDNEFIMISTNSSEFSLNKKYKEININNIDINEIAHEINGFMECELRK